MSKQPDMVWAKPMTIHTAGIDITHLTKFTNYQHHVLSLICGTKPEPDR